MDRYVFAACAALSVFVGEPALAEEAEPSPAPTAAPAATVTVEAARTVDGAGATGTATTLDTATLAPRGMRTADALQRVPGVDIEDFGAGLGSRVRIRGASPDEVIVLVDGVRVDPSAGGGADLESVPLALFDRVEILRGTGSSRYGAGAIGGVVSFRTDPATRGALASFTANSFGLRRSTAGVVLGSGDWAVDLSATQDTVGDSYRFHDDLRGEERLRTNAGSDGWGGSAGAEGPLAGGRLSARLFGNLREGGAPGLSEYPTPQAHHAEDTAVGAARWVAPWLEVGLSKREATTSFADPAPLLGAPIDSRSHESTTSGDALIRRAGEGVWLLTAGADGRDERSTDRSLGEHERRVAGAHASMEVRPWGALIVEAALRAEADFDRGSQGARSAALPSLGLGWRAEGWSLHAHGGRAWRLPTFAELWLPSQETVSGNPDLRPEDAWTGDAGVETTLAVPGGSLRAGATVFATRLANAIVFAPVSAYRYEPLNAGAASMAGVELELIGTWRGLSFQADATHLETKRDETNRPLPFRPRERIFSRVAGLFAGGAIEPFVELRWKDASYADFFGNLEVPGGALLGAGTTLEIPRGALAGFAFTVEGTNLENADVRDARNFPLPGRAFQATVSWRGKRRSTSTDSTKDRP